MASASPKAGAGGTAIELWITDPGATTPAERERWLASWLDDAERARVRDARSASRRVEIVVGRALLRAALADAMGSADPGQLRFTTDPGGRPRLASGGDVPGGARVALDFSVAHTRGLAVCAVALGGGPVGVDAEPRARRTEPLAIARRFFSRADAAAVEMAATPAERTERFLERWTLREAYTKLLGTPLLELDRETVAFSAEAPGGVRLTRPGAAPGEAWRWWLVRPTPVHVVALGWHGGEAAVRSVRVTLRRWPVPALTR